jgi:3-dehydroquinate synthase
VKNDEFEKGERMKLNFGHTVGHAIEKESGGKTPHGEAVAIGMVIAANLSIRKGLLQKKDAERLENLIAGYGLPIKISNRAGLGDAIKKDKKKFGQKIKMALLEGIGRAKIVDVEISELEGVLNE